MNRLMARLVAIVVALFLPAAQAADLAKPVYKAPPPVAPAYHWGGFYVGGHAGLGFAHNRFGDLGSGLDAADFVAEGVLAGG